MGTTDLNERTNALAEYTTTLAQMAVDVGNHAEAKRVLTSGIRDLRDYKRELTEAERNIRAQAQDARLQNRASGQTLGMFVGSKGRGVLARGRAAGGRNISQQQAAMLQPYARAKMNIDSAIAGLDRAKAAITDEVARLRESGGVHTVVIKERRAAYVEASEALADDEAQAVVPVPAAPVAAEPPPPPPVPAQWAPDPQGRHQHRWWDGTRWTEHVANDGEVTVHPL